MSGPELTGWRYSINYGPDGEENWANLITPEGEHAANIRIHHARRIVAALSAASQPAPAVGEWQDMPSAPKDGTRVWAYDADHGYEAKVAFIQGEWECIDFDDYGMNVGFYPTHWMPLPAKPVSKGA